VHVRLARKFPDQAKRRVPADHRESLEQFLLLNRQPVDARGEHPLHGDRQTRL